MVFSVVSFQGCLTLLIPVLVVDWRMTDPNHPMNALMRLNQIQPGLQYRLLSQSGPVHAPVFTMSVDIHGTTYQATGNSKRTAKLQVALKVLVLSTPHWAAPTQTLTQNKYAVITCYAVHNHVNGPSLWKYVNYSYWLYVLAMVVTFQLSYYLFDLR